MSLAQGNNTPTRPRIEPGSPDPESDALTTRPVRPPHWSYDVMLRTFQMALVEGYSNNKLVIKHNEAVHIMVLVKKSFMIFFSQKTIKLIPWY